MSEAKTPLRRPPAPSTAGPTERSPVRDSAVKSNEYDANLNSEEEIVRKKVQEEVFAKAKNYEGHSVRVKEGVISFQRAKHYNKVQKMI